MQQITRCKLRAQEALECHGLKIFAFVEQNEAEAPSIGATLKAEKVAPGCELPLTCVLDREDAQELAEDLARAGILPKCQQHNGATIVLPDDCKAKASGDLLIVEAPNPERRDPFETGEIEGEETGAYVRMPKLNLVCQKCGKVARPIAHDTGDGWLMSLDCECQEINDAAHYDWPKGRPSLNGKALRALGFDTV